MVHGVRGIGRNVVHDCSWLIARPFPPRKTGRGGRGKDRPDGSPGGGPGGGGGDSPGDRSGVKLYMQPPLLEMRVPEPEIVFLTDLPGGLDNNEWMASHSELLKSAAAEWLWFLSPIS